MAALAVALTQTGLTGDFDIKQHITGAMKRNNEHNILYRFTIGNESDVSRLASIKIINGFSVKIEKMKSHE